MKSFEVKLRVDGVTTHTVVQASTPSDARRIALAQFSGAKILGTRQI